MMIQVELSNSNRLHQLRIIMFFRRKIDRSIAPRVCSVYRKKLSREFSLCTLVSTELKFYIASRLNMLQSDDVVVVMVGDNGYRGTAADKRREHSPLVEAEELFR